MDDLIKILQKLMSESPKPKGGIADTAEGIPVSYTHLRAHET